MGGLAFVFISLIFGNKFWLNLKKRRHIFPLIKPTKDNYYVEEEGENIYAVFGSLIGVYATIFVLRAEMTRQTSPLQLKNISSELLICP